MIPFYGIKGEQKCGEKPAQQFGGKWAVYFDHDKADLGDLKPNAIGVFEQKGNGIRGTFMTETGDYRFLEGCVEGNAFSLNTFDGAHIFRFDAAMLESGDEREMIKGTFRSGNHYQTPWVAVRDDSVTLRAADDLTYLNPGYDRLTFSFPDLNGDTVSLSDERFAGKPVIVQIMGSWCPNCMDESRLYAGWYKKYNPQGLEIIGLAFERHEDFGKASAAVRRLSDRLDIQYPMLIAGRASKTEAAEKLPMLNHVLSFPTSIFIDKTGAVRKIHTGFNGPGTGKFYDEFVKEYEALIEEMLGK
jgi:thiol-disulfide isomerase/thioredoxin